jgi:hypothetical protein
MPDHIHTYEVPTFRDHRPIQDNRAVEDHLAYDAFLLYSDDEVRMRTLSGGILGSAREESTMTNRGGVIRKTALSFELHPSVFFDDLFSDDNVAENININAGEDLVNNLKNQNPQLAALVATLFGVDLGANIRTPRAA